MMSTGLMTSGLGRLAMMTAMFYNISVYVRATKKLYGEPCLVIAEEIIECLVQGIDKEKRL